MSASADATSPRRYRSSRRTEQAAATRDRIVDAARHLVVEQGYAATTVSQVAARAGVAVDTVYAAVGRKPELLRQVLETAISGTDTAVAPEDRDYVRAVRAAPTARAKLAAYVDGLLLLQPRLAPVVLALRDAAATDPESADLWGEITQRRAGNMRDFARDLRATGELRADLDDGEVADIIWSMNAPEYWTLLVDERGWSKQRFGAHLVDCWSRTLLAHP
ncbi:TetR/AcrR family transcriptional regulator [Arsenicicoccus bolidensis]|uniref:TetR/AcrR family transcriptional regulator n=1 Tax=Arsenicicoccus bolidensis TaxID=229480 RepID=UPI0003FBD1DA|nr:TetR/AcrR family transcriptional regulator [Arsenicicoccus bolidensis]